VASCPLWKAHPRTGYPDCGNYQREIKLRERIAGSPKAAAHSELFVQSPYKSMTRELILKERRNSREIPRILLRVTLGQSA